MDEALAVKRNLREHRSASPRLKRRSRLVLRRCAAARLVMVEGHFPAVGENCGENEEEDEEAE